MSSTPLDQTQAALCVQSKIQPEVDRLTLSFQSQFDSEEGTAAVFASFGITDLAMLEGRDESAILSARLVFSQLSKTIAIATGARLSPSELAQAGANSVSELVIDVHRSAERCLGQLYEAANPETLSAVFSAPGAVESLKDSQGRVSISLFPDGSALASLEMGQENAALTRAIFDNARVADDAVGEIEASKVRSQLKLAMELSMESEFPRAGLAHLQDRLKEALESATLDTFRELSALPFATIAVASPLDLLSSFERDIEHGAWKSGVSVSVNGAACPSPQDLKDALGASPSVSLDDALARLRASRGAVEATTDEAAQRSLSTKPRQTKR